MWPNCDIKFKTIINIKRLIGRRKGEKKLSREISCDMQSKLCSYWLEKLGYVMDMYLKLLLGKVEFTLCDGCIVVLAILLLFYREIRDELDNSQPEPTSGSSGRRSTWWEPKLKYFTWPTVPHLSTRRPHTLWWLNSCFFMCADFIGRV